MVYDRRFKLAICFLFFLSYVMSLLLKYNQQFKNIYIYSNNFVLRLIKIIIKSISQYAYIWVIRENLCPSQLVSRTINFLFRIRSDFLEKKQVKLHTIYDGSLFLQCHDSLKNVSNDV